MVLFISSHYQKKPCTPRVSPRLAPVFVLLMRSSGGGRGRRRRRRIGQRHFRRRAVMVTWRRVSSVTLLCLSFALSFFKMTHFSPRTLRCGGGAPRGRSGARSQRRRERRLREKTAAVEPRVTWPACGRAFDKKMAWARRSGEDNNPPTDRLSNRPSGNLTPAAGDRLRNSNGTLPSLNTTARRHVVTPAGRFTRWLFSIWGANCSGANAPGC